MISKNWSICIIFDLWVISYKTTDTNTIISPTSNKCKNYPCSYPISYRGCKGIILVQPLVRNKVVCVCLSERNNK